MTLSDTRVSQLINTEFVPCWESVRAVPKVTIDFGGGHTLKRTLTGNTVTTICLPNGQPIDAFPGVYTPDDFATQLRGTLDWVRRSQLLDQPEDRAAQLVQAWHHGQVTTVAANGGAITISKMGVESPILRALRLNPPRHPAAPQPDARQIQRAANARPILARDLANQPEQALTLLADRLEDVSKEPFRAEELKQRFPPMDHEPTPQELGDMSLRLDSRTNLTLVRPAVHLLFGTYPQLPPVKEWRDAVYTRILHVPVNDPYMGLTASSLPGSEAP